MISAHAASVGDALLGVPLHCAAGLYPEAVNILQVCVCVCGLDWPWVLGLELF